MKMRKSRWKTNVIFIVAISATVVVIVMNVLDIPFVVAHHVIGGTSSDPITTSVEMPVVVPDLEIYTFQPETLWSRDYNVCSSIEKRIYHGDFFRVPLESQVGSLSVFIHDPTKDGISKRIYNERKYEPNLLNIILLFLRTDEETNFIDIGANIGLLSLQVAKYGRRVLAIEPVKENIQHLCASVHYGRFQEYFKIVSNAASKDHVVSSLVLGRHGDFGGNYLNVSDIHKLKKQVDGKFFYKSSSIPISTFALDDLLSWEQVTFFKKSFLKIDVEGTEEQVLLGAVKFFENSIIHGVIMEWTWHRGRQSADIILTFMKRFKFNPYEFLNVKLTRKKLFAHNINLTSLFKKLDYSDFNTWPDNVLWIPVTSS